MRENQDVVAVLPPGYGAHFSVEELRAVGVEPFGDLNVFRCRVCHWTVERSGFGLLLPHIIAMDGVREVVDHAKREHEQ